jgi:hypothetical protein
LAIHRAELTSLFRTDIAVPTLLDVIAAIHIFAAAAQKRSRRPCRIRRGADDQR